MQGTSQDSLIDCLIKLYGYGDGLVKRIAKCKVIWGKAFKMKDGGELKE
jgi:hypothetical protein